MDGLRAIEAHQMNSAATPATRLTANKLAENEVNGMKTPRRGLGMVVNESKTPGAKSLQFSSKKSAVKHQKKIEVFQVFEDEQSEELENQNDIVLEKEEKLHHSPIERASRLSLGHDSIGSEIQHQCDEQELTELFDDRYENKSIDTSDEEGEIDDVNDESMSIQLGAGSWDGSPIELASRIERYSPDYIDAIDIEDVQLYNDFPEVFTAEEIEGQREMIRMSFKDFAEMFLDDVQDEEDDDKENEQNVTAH